MTWVNSLCARRDFEISPLQKITFYLKEEKNMSDEGQFLTRLAVKDQRNLFERVQEKIKSDTSTITQSLWKNLNQKCINLLKTIGLDN